MEDASMRPGQLTPENLTPNDPYPLDRRASMRPGQLTPENAYETELLHMKPVPLQ